MNCTVWTCQHCGTQNHIIDDRCIKCGQAYGSPKKELRQHDLVFTCIPCAIRIGESLSTPIRYIGKGFCACEHIDIRDIGDHLGWKPEEEIPYKGIRTQMKSLKE